MIVKSVNDGNFGDDGDETTYEIKYRLSGRSSGTSGTLTAGLFASATTSCSCDGASDLEPCNIRRAEKDAERLDHGSEHVRRQVSTATRTYWGTLTCLVTRCEEREH